MRVSWIAALWLFSTAPATAELYSIDDMLDLQSYGKTVFDPNGKWAVLERYRPYQNASAYHFDAFTKRMLGHIMRVDLVDDKRMRPLFPQSTDAGYWIGSASPDGRFLSVFRLSANRLSLGVVDMASSQVRWLDINPVAALLNPVPVWRDSRRLLVLTSSREALAYPLDIGSRLQRDLPALWERTKTGKNAGVSVIESSDIAAAEHLDHRRVLEIDVVSNAIRSITDGRIVDMAISGDNSFLAVTEEMEDHKLQRDALVSPSARPRQHQVRVISLNDGRSLTPCFACDVMPGLMAWSDQDASLLYFSRRSGGNWSSGRLNVFEVQNQRSLDIQGGDIHPWLPEDDSSAQIVRAGWRGREVLMLARHNDGTPRWVSLTSGQRWPALPCQPSQLLSSKDDLFVPCPDGLWLVRKGNTAKQIRPGRMHLDRPAEETFDTGIRARYRGIVPAKSRSTATTSHDGIPRLQAIDDLSSTALAMPQSGGRLLGLSPRTRIGLAISRSPKGASRLWLLQENQPAVQIDAINSHLDNVDLPRAIPLPAAADGTVHWLFLPRTARPDKSLPLVIMPYPGSVFTADGEAPMIPDGFASAVNPLLIASLGYAVMIPSVPHDRESGEPARDLTRLVEAAADAAVKSGHIDASRIIVYGHSFGGYTALVVASRSRRFRGVIAGAAAPDLTLQHGQFLPYDQVNLAEGFPLGSSFGWAELGQGRLKAAPWQDHDRYVRNSPYYALETIRTPVLLIHGDLDPVAALGPERMFSGLYRKGSDVTLLRYWGEGHVIRSPANVRNMWRFLAHWLSQRLNEAPSLTPENDVAPGG